MQCINFVFYLLILVYALCGLNAQNDIVFLMDKVFQQILEFSAFKGKPNITSVLIDGDLVHLEWQQNFTDDSNLKRYQIVVSYLNYEIQWPVQGDVSLANLSNPISTNLTTNSSFECFNSCINNVECIGAVLVRNEENTLNCIIHGIMSNLSNETMLNETITPIETFIISDYSNKATIKNLPFGHEFVFRVSLLLNGTWSQLSNPSEPLDTKKKFDLKIETNGLQTATLKWTPIGIAQVTSKYRIRTGEVVYEIDESHMETYPIEPQYYEEPLQDGFKMANFDECKEFCFRNYSCVQFIYFSNNASVIGIDEQTCFLLTRYNIFNASPKHPNAQINGVKTNIQEFKLRNIKLNKNYTFKLEYLSPNGLESNTTEIQYLQNANPKLSAEFDTNTLDLKLDWSIDLLINSFYLDRFAILYTINGSKPQYYINSNSRDDQVNAQDCFIACFNDTMCKYFKLTNNSECELKQKPIDADECVTNFCGQIEGYTSGKKISGLFANTDYCFSLVIQDTQGDQLSIDSTDNSCARTELMTTLTTSVDIFIENAYLQLNCDPLQNQTQLIQSISWLKNNVGLNEASYLLTGTFNETLIIKSLKKAIHDGSYTCMVSIKNSQVLESNTVNVSIYEMIPTIIKVERDANKSIIIDWSVTNEENFILTRFELQLSSDSFGNQAYTWSRQTQVTQYEVIGESLENTTVISFFECFQKCTENARCKGVTAQNYLNDNEQNCFLLSKIMSISDTYKNLNQETLIIPEYSNSFVINDLPYNQKYRFKVRVYQPDANIWSDYSEPSDEIDLTIDLEAGYTRLGFSRVLFNWINKQGYVTSRYDVSINNTYKYKKIIPEHFKKYQIGIPYYELPFNNEVKVQTEDECFLRCVDNTDCVQSIYFQEEVKLPDKTVVLPNTCFLKTDLNIFNGFLHNEHAVVCNIKNDETSYTMDIRGNDRFNAFVKGITPYGTEFYSKQFSVDMSDLDPGINCVTNLNRLETTCKWKIDTIAIKKYSMRYEGIDPKIAENYYFIDTLAALYPTATFKQLGEREKDMQYCYSECFSLGWCYATSLGPVTGCKNYNEIEIENCDDCVKMRVLTTDSKDETIDRIFYIPPNIEYSFQYIFQDAFGMKKQHQGARFKYPFSTSIKLLNETKEKESGMIECSFNNIDQSVIDEIIWYKNGQKIGDRFSWNMTFSRYSPYLTFKYFNHIYHNGYYTCEVSLTNKQSFQSANKVQILVKFGPNLKFTISEPLTHYKSTIETYEDEPIEMNCSVEGYLTPNVTLSHNGKLLTGADGIQYNGTYDQFTNGLILTYTKVNRNANGTYVCRTDDGTREAIYDVKVYYPFKLVSKNSILVYNTSLECNDCRINIPCIINGYDPKQDPIPRWQYSNRTDVDEHLVSTSSNQTYRTTLFDLGKPERKYTGTYICLNSWDLNDDSLVEILVKSQPSEPFINETLINYNQTFIRWIIEDFGDSTLNRVYAEMTNLNYWPNSTDTVGLSQVYSSEVSLIENVNQVEIYDLEFNKKIRTDSLVRIWLQNEVGSSVRSNIFKAKCNDKKCEKPVPASGNNNITIIVVSVVCAVCLVTLLIVLFRYKTQISQYFQKKNHNTPKRPSTSRQKTDFTSVQSETQMEQIIPKPSSYDDRNDSSDDDLYVIESLYTRWTSRLESIEFELAHEYQQIKNPDDLSCNEAVKDCNYKKSKYKLIYPYDYNRVVLNSKVGVEGSDFINASNIEDCNHAKKYIASQAPTNETVNDFWRMVYEKKIKAIVMLANFYEDNPPRLKCLPYWDDRNKVQYENIYVKVTSAENNLVYIKRKFILTNIKYPDSIVIVDHYHYLKWPDKSVPDETQTLFSLIERVNREHQGEHWPILIHCSAGVGRTGTYIALDSLYEMLKIKGRINIMKYVMHLRRQRIYFVQALEQYKFIHTAIIERYLFGNTTMHKKTCKNEFKKLLMPNMQHQKCKLEILYENLTRWKDKYRSQNVFTKYPDKFKSTKFIPYDAGIVKITPVNQDPSSIYIDAVSFECSQMEAQFIIAADPDCENISDFLRMIFEQRPNFIVSLSTRNYLPNVNESISNNNILVTNTKKIIRNDAVLYSLEFVNTDNYEKVTVFYFDYTSNWYGKPLLPTNMKSFLNLINSFIISVEPKNSNISTTPLTLVHSVDGGDQCGLFIAAVLLQHRIRIHEQFDVVQIVRLLRKSRNNLISKYEHFKYLYEIFCEEIVNDTQNFVNQIDKFNDHNDTDLYDNLYVNK